MCIQIPWRGLAIGATPLMNRMLKTISGIQTLTIIQLSVSHGSKLLLFVFGEQIDLTEPICAMESILCMTSGFLQRLNGNMQPVAV